MDSLMKDYKGLMDRYRTMTEAERLSIDGKRLHGQILALKIAIDKACRMIASLTDNQAGNYKLNIQ